MNEKKIVKIDLAYQTRASDEAVELLETNKTEVGLQAPTGSGKTAIMASTIEKYFNIQSTKGIETTVIFFSPQSGNINHQNYSKFKEQLKNDWVSNFKVKYIGTEDKKGGDYLSGIKTFENRTVYFFSWGNLIDGGIILNPLSERDTIYDVITRTKEDGRKILLVLDEAHIGVRNMGADTRLSFMKKLDPDKIIYLSATLDREVDVSVSLAEVREEEAIKKSVFVSTGDEYDEIISDYDDFTVVQELISVANERQKQVIKAYKKRGIKQNPVTLIQIPNATGVGEHQQTEVERVLNKLGYTKNIDYTSYLSGKKEVLKEELVRGDSHFKFIIFKQAIATGWDIPRANILVRLREPKTTSLTRFDIQTLGRIMRNPLFKYYDNELIDNSFVFTKDTAYLATIEAEDYVTKVNKHKLYPLSNKGKLCKVELNCLKYKDKTEMNNNEELAKIVFEKTGKELAKTVLDAYNLNSEHYIKEYNENKSFRGKIYTNIIKDKTTLEKLIAKANFSKTSTNTRDSLALITIKLKTLLRGNKFYINLTKDILTELANKVEPKKVMKFLVASFSDPLFSKKGLTYLNLLGSKRDYYIKSNYQIEKKPFTLPKKFRYSNAFGGDGSTTDEVSTYKIEGKWTELDSENEKQFFKKLQWVTEVDSSLLDKHHIFRNGVSNESFFIEYINEMNMISRFYPDFISFDDKNKVITIMEVKGVPGKDIDKATEIKLDTIGKHLDKIYDGSEYELKVVKVMINQEEKVLFQDVEKKIMDWKDFLSGNKESVKN